MQWHLLGSINRGIMENARQDLETNIRSSDKSEWTIEAKSQGEPRGERDVTRLRNPTEDKRAFRRMLTQLVLTNQLNLVPRSSHLRRVLS